MAFVPRPLFFPSILDERIGKAFTDVPKFVLRRGSKSQNFTYLPLLSPTRGFRVSFPASTRGPNVGRSLVLPLASHRGPKLESADEVLDFENVCLSLWVCECCHSRTQRAGWTEFGLKS
ncbi:hypothetical protein AVEN_13082-1 [Araneus ventricosus]|uniref:Uncharacterized protein n=1 Tax=Araneus ventricosus TaxID=182803 RepID=A0A4Y2TLI0_ARAVE|nr:hypothetical protein AVEN_13082-1 [Araneus ventricosus]